MGETPEPPSVHIQLVENPFEGQPPLAGRYAFITEIGAGPLGRVYSGRDLETGTRVAIKVLTPRISADVNDPTCKERYVAAVRRVAPLRHPGVARVFAVDTVLQDGHLRVAYSMEHVATTPARRLLDGKASMSADRVVDLVDRVAEIVEAAHTMGLLHLDLHLGNVFVGQDDEVRLSDFGIRGAFQADITPETPESSPFLAPEQRAGGDVSVATDVFGLGWLLRALLTWSMPDHKDPVGVLPGDLDLVVNKACRVRPEDRFPTVAAFRKALRDPKGVRTASGVVAPVPAPAPVIATEPAASKGMLYAGLAVVAVVLVLACVGGAAALGLFGGAGPTAANPAPGPVGAPETAPAPAPPAPTVPVPQMLRVDSAPPGAQIFEGETSLGTTPSLVEVPSGGARTVTLRLDGYAPREVVLRGDGTPPEIVRLEAELAPVRVVTPRPVARPTARPAPAPAPRPRGDDLILNR
jgi:serine/threonine protein kinase